MGELLCLAPVGKRAKALLLSVHPSVCPSVAYIVNNSRTQTPSVPTFGTKVNHLRCNSHTSFKVKRSKVRVTKPINADTHRASYLLNGKAYKLQDGVRMEDNDPHQPQAPWAPRSKVKVISWHRPYVSSLPLLNSENKMLYLCYYKCRRLVNYPRRPRISGGCSACMAQSATRDSACSWILTFRRETKSHLFRQSHGWRGAVYFDGRQTSALSCATVLNLYFCKVPPQLCDGSTLIHDICSSSSSSIRGGHTVLPKPGSHTFVSLNPLLSQFTSDVGLKTLKLVVIL